MPGRAGLGWIVGSDDDARCSSYAGDPARPLSSLGVRLRWLLIDSHGLARISAAIPLRSSESFIELTYQVQVAPWWTVLPDLRYVFTPGGGIPNPLAPGQRIGNELILGARTNVTS